MKIPNDYDHNRIFGGDTFSGTYVAHTATPWGDIVPFACDAEIHSLDESRVEELRAYRKARKNAGLKMQPLRDDAFQQEVCVLFGPQLSPKQAIAALERMIEYIRSNGLLIGLVEPDGDFYVEKIDGTIDPPLPLK